MHTCPSHNHNPHRNESPIIAANCIDWLHNWMAIITAHNTQQAHRAFCQCQRKYKNRCFTHTAPTKNIDYVTVRTKNDGAIDSNVLNVIPSDSSSTAFIMALLAREALTQYRKILKHRTRLIRCMKTLILVYGVLLSIFWHNHMLTSLVIVPEMNDHE